VIPVETPATKSILARLLNEAKRTGETYNTVLARYVGFRLLYRLTQSRHADGFLLKGATMFLFWLGEMHRPTKDFDLLGTSADANELRSIFTEIANIACEQDGVIFDPDSIVAEAIREEQSYGGVRVTLLGYIGKARIPLQIDIGFGDAVTPEPNEVELPGMIRDVPGAKMKCYNMETSFAEKLEAMARLGLANSRMKDFFDLSKLVRDTDLSHETLGRAIQATFKRRGSELPLEIPVALTETFWGDPIVAVRWRAFVRKNEIVSPLDDLSATCQVIADTVGPILAALASGQTGLASYTEEL